MSGKINPFQNKTFENFKKDIDFLSEMTPPNKLGWKIDNNGQYSPSKWVAPFAEKRQFFKDLGIMIQDANRTLYSSLSNSSEIVDSEKCSELAIQWSEIAISQNLDLDKVSKVFEKYSDHFANLQIFNNKREKKISENFQKAANNIKNRQKKDQSLVGLIDSLDAKSAQ